MASPNTTEIRVEARDELVAVLDGVSCAKRLTRNQLVLQVLSEWADARVHEANVLQRVLRSNPALSADIGKDRT